MLERAAKWTLACAIQACGCIYLFRSQDGHSLQTRSQATCCSGGTGRAWVVRCRKGKLTVKNIEFETGREKPLPDWERYRRMFSALRDSYKLLSSHEMDGQNIEIWVRKDLGDAQDT